MRRCGGLLATSEALMLKQQEGSNPDGTPHWHYTLTQEEHDAGYAALFTGPIAGTLSLPDGAAYDVSEDCIPVKAEHVGELHLAIHRAHHAAGRFLDVPLPELKDVALPARKT
jgi:hypothetical protein